MLKSLLSMQLTQQTTSILNDINKASAFFLEPITTEETCAVIVKEAIKLVKADHGSIVLRQKGEFKRIYTTLPIAKTVQFRKRGSTYQAFKKHQPLVQNPEQIKKWHPEMAKIGIKSNVFIPLANRGDAIGVLIVNSLHENHFGSLELDALRLFGAMASLAIRKAQLYDEIKRALESRDLFISMAAHEFRTPITTINGYAQLLYRKLTTKNLPEAKWAQELWGEGHRLSLLVNELLEVSRIKEGKLQYELKENSLKEIINKSVSEFRFIHPARNLILQDHLATGQDRVIADDNKILQVLVNVLDNAAKFSPIESEITFSASFRKPYFILTIIDHGRGIAKEELGRIFEGFYRGKDEYKEGMGLGLYLVKDIVDAHNGDIKINSKVGKGTKFRIRLFKSKL